MFCEHFLFFPASLFGTTTANEFPKTYILDNSHQDVGHTIPVHTEGTMSHPINLELTAIQSHSTWVYKGDWKKCKSYALLTNQYLYY
jgi:hypothetical protein